jgi:hypothetical protein
MEIVIDIPEELYEVYKGRLPMLGDVGMGMIAQSIAKGTPLPKEHGRLIDGEKVLDDIEKKYPASVSETEQSKRYARLVYYWAVKNAPTIIEADKESKE